MLPSKAPNGGDVLLNDFKSQWRLVEMDVLGAVSRVGESGWYILGQEVRQFEEALATHWGMGYAAGCASGLDAIELSLRALGLQAGERVLTTPLSAFATTLAIVRAGGVPVFVDVDDHGLIDLVQCESVFSSHDDLRFFVPVDLYGHALSSAQLARLKTEYGLLLIEDCAQAVGAKSYGQPAGAYADLVATSFYPTKNLGAFGDGGAVLGNDVEQIEAVKRLRDYGQSSKYVHSELGLNSRLDELQAAILRDALLPRLNEFTKRRQAIASVYLQELSNPNLRPISAPEGSESVWHLFCVLVEGNRDSFQQHLKSRGIQNGIHYPVIIPDQPAMSNQPHTVAGQLPNARRFAAAEVSLPIHPFLSESDVERVISACNSWQP